MGNTKYSLDFKLLVVLRYRRGEFGYKRLAHVFGIKRDLVRDWCLNPKLKEVAMARLKKTEEEKDLEYYKASEAFWRNYALLIEKEIAKQEKKTSDSGNSEHSQGEPPNES